jgi:hypothetical protein
MTSKPAADEQDPAAIRAVHERVSQILTAGEEILHVAMQNALTAMTTTPDSVVLTTKRFIIFRPKILGGAEFEDHIWRDLRDAKLEEGILDSKISLRTTEGLTLGMEHLHKTAARRVYSLAQQMEERMIEERRAREMEEKRAAAGGISIGAAAAQPAQPTAPKDDPLEKLSQLKKMLDAGLITQQEYDTKKADLLSRM